MTWNAFKVGVANFFATSGVALLNAVLLFVIGYFLIKLALKLVSRMLAKAKIEKSARRFLYTAIKFLLYLLLIMIIASTLGISITGFVAILSALGLAISLALQGSLSNMANGIVIIVTKPFKENDVVTIQGFEGTVKEIKLTHTVITGLDNKQVNIPNKIVVENVIVNGSVNDQKRVTYEFLVAYNTDVEKAKDIILKSFSKTDYVLTEPKPLVVLNALKENGIVIKAQYSVETKHYSYAYHALLEDIFNEFKKQGIVMPFAQLDVRVKQEKESLPFYTHSKLTNKPEEKVIMPEKPYEHNEPVAEEAKQPAKNDLDYLEISSQDDVKVIGEDEEVEEEKEQKTTETEKEEKSGLKIFKKQTKEHKKPTVIIKKK